MRRIGLLGGTFNPIHLAHLTMAEQAYKQFSLDEMWLVPAKIPPHKRDQVFSDTHRLNMLRLAISEHPSLSLHLYEFLKEGVSYTVETLKAFHKMYPDTEFYYLMGEDSLKDFDKWYHPEEISSLATIIVAPRSEDSDAFLALLTRRRKEYGNAFPVLSMPQIPISSTGIRSGMKDGDSMLSSVPEKVYEYMKEHQLYC